MTLGPSRRSKNRLALDTSSSPSIAERELSFAPFRPRSPMGKSGAGGPRNRKAGFSHTSDYNIWKSSRRRFPFIVWMTSVSIYCCVMYLRMSSYRVLGQSHYARTFFKPDGDVVNYQTQTNLDKDDTSRSSQNESAETGKNDSRHAIGVGIVHIVETRFMQGQSRLLELGLARLLLFEAFCLPSMLSQTSGDFIWIIRADPNLHPAIADTMVQLLKEKQNFILLGSNSNPEGFGRTKSPFNDFLQGAPVLSGNLSLVEEAYEKSTAGAILLETRLDADDGLNLNFIKTVQIEAIRHLVNSDNAKESGELWRLWCIHSTVEWHPLNPYPTSPKIATAIPEGYLVIYSDRGRCSTPGLTFGYGLGASRASLGIDHLRHDEINKKIHSCEKETNKVEVECVSRLTKLAPGGAVRARTTTSAGMSNVLTGNEDIDNKINAFKRKTKDKRLTQQFFKQKQLWALLSRDFSIDPLSARTARSTIVKRMQFIAEDNMKGQCTAGHSCKNLTKALLERISDPEESDQSDDDNDDSQ